MTVARVGTGVSGYRGAAAFNRLVSTRVVGTMASYNTVTSATYNITLPVGTVAGDLMVVCGRPNTSTATTLTHPAGWNGNASMDTGSAGSHAGWRSAGIVSAAMVSAGYATITLSAARAQIWVAVVLRGFTTPALADWATQYGTLTTGTWQGPAGVSAALDDVLLDFWLLALGNVTSHAWQAPTYPVYTYVAANGPMFVGLTPVSVAGAQSARSLPATHDSSTGYRHYTVKLARV